MPIQKVSQKPVNGTPVKFHDKDNNKDVTYNIPVGAKITTTENTYKVKKDGVYLNNKKQAKLNVPLFDMVALQNFDVNKDGSIDKKDAKAFEAKGKKASLAKEINEDLAKKGSDYYVDSREAGGGYENAGCSKEYGFGVTFSNSKNGRESKHFGIEF